MMGANSPHPTTLFQVELFPVGNHLNSLDLHIRNAYMVREVEVSANGRIQIRFAHCRFVIIKSSSQRVSGLSSILYATTFTGNNINDVGGIAIYVVVDGKF